MTVLTVQPPPARPSRDLARLSDEALLSLVAASDDDALAALYDRFGRVAYGLALRILRDETLAQDAVQEAFLGVWRNADRFLAERAKASTWILTLVHRRAVDLVRREDIRRGEPLERAPEPAAPDDRRGRGLARLSAAGSSRRRSRNCRPSSARRSSSATTAASPRASSPNASTSRSGRSRAGCSPASRGCATCSTRPVSKARTRKVGGRGARKLLALVIS